MGLKKKTSEKKKKKEVPVPAAAKPQVTSGKPAENEIDAIFGQKKRRKSTPESQDTVAAEDGNASKISSQKKKKVKKMISPREEGARNAGMELRGGKSGKAVAEPYSKPRKKTADGLTIYGADELKWNSKDAGGKADCPFDCDCCF